MVICGQTHHTHWQYVLIFDVTLLGQLPNFGSRPNTIGGKFPSVRHSTKSFFDFDEIWYTDEMRKSNDHARIQGQGQEPMKV